MNDPIPFAGFVLLIVLVVWSWGSYQFDRGLKIGFSRGLKSANRFIRLKRTANDQIDGRN